MDLGRLASMFMALAIAEAIHLYQDYSYAKSQHAKGCIEMGIRGEKTKIAPGITVDGVVWFCDERKNP